VAGGGRFLDQRDAGAVAGAVCDFGQKDEWLFTLALLL